MALDEKISGLIGRIYESVGDPASWEEVLHEVRSLLGARCLMQSLADLGQHDMVRSTVIGEPRRPEGVEEYEARAYEIDPTFRWAIAHPLAGFCDTDEIVPKEGYLENDFIQWNLSEWIGSTHWIVGYTPPGERLTFGLSAHPWAQDGPLPQDKKRLFKMLFEHMERAIRLSSRPPLFASESDAVVLLDRLGRVRAISPAAQELLECDDGLSVWDERLHAGWSPASARLNEAILSALTAQETGGFGGAVSIPRRSGKRDLLVTIVPLSNPPSPFQAYRPAALVRIVDPELGVSPSASERWAALFGLTPAEARLAESLINHEQNVRNAADALGVSYATARVHLKHLLEKTNTHSQSQLSRLLSRVE